MLIWLDFSCSLSYERCLLDWSSPCCWPRLSIVKDGGLFWLDRAGVVKHMRTHCAFLVFVRTNKYIYMWKCKSFLYEVCVCMFGRRQKGYDGDLEHKRAISLRCGVLRRMCRSEKRPKAQRSYTVNVSFLATIFTEIWLITVGYKYRMCSFHMWRYPQNLLSVFGECSLQ